MYESKQILFLNTMRSGHRPGSSSVLYTNQSSLVPLDAKQDHNIFGSHFADLISSSLKSQSCFANSSLLASLLVFSTLQSAKYFPVTPLS